MPVATACGFVDRLHSRLLQTLGLNSNGGDSRTYYR